MLTIPSGTLTGPLGRKSAAFLALHAWTCMLIVATLFCANAAAQGQATACSLVHGGGYGPYDYRKDRDKLPQVEPAHFTPEVENLIRGQSGPLGHDIDYTLRAFPNHHRALLAMMRLGERTKSLQADRANHSVECFFKRALHFAPDDTVVRMLYATFLAKADREADAIRQLERATLNAGDNPFSHYNIGLVYVDLKRYDKALRQAHRAMALGFPKPDLMNALKQAGQWKEPSAAAAAPSASEPQAGKD